MVSSLVYGWRMSNTPNPGGRVLDTVILCQNQKCTVRLGTVYFPALNCRTSYHCAACLHVTVVESRPEGLVASCSPAPIPVPKGRGPEAQLRPLQPPK